MQLGWSLEELGDRMGGAEFVDWMAYAELEPFGPMQEDLRAGQVAVAIVQALGAKRKGGGRWRPSDFFPSLRPRAPRGGAAPRGGQDLGQQVAVVKQLAGMFGRFTPGGRDA